MMLCCGVFSFFLSLEKKRVVLCVRRSGLLVIERRGKGRDRTDASLLKASQALLIKLTEETKICGGFLFRVGWRCLSW